MGNSCCSSNEMESPIRLEFGFIDWIKAFISWILSYRKTYHIKPGLYYIGKEYKISSPLLVTCNYHMTVFLLWRILKRRNLRILVIDTKGINVWCSSGKGQFSAQKIIDQLAEYERQSLTESDKLEIILPKLSLSGVRLSHLKKANIIPKIGPIYAYDLPEFLDKGSVDCDDDHYKFNLRNRLFTLLPSFVQFTQYMAIIAFILWILNFILKTGTWWQILPVSLSIPVLYIILFPVLPTSNFSFKGITLFIFQVIILAFFFASRIAELSVYLIISHLLFYLGTNIFFGLYYTGNSGVSNYSLVKKEIATFLPVTFMLYLGALVMIILQGVLR